MPGCLDPAAVETNIVFADVASPSRPLAAWVDALAAEGVRVTTVGGRVRMLTHVGIAAADVDAALAAWRRAAATLGSAGSHPAAR